MLNKIKRWITDIKSTNYARQLLDEWIQLYPQYAKRHKFPLKYSKIHKDLYSSAIQSFVSFLRTKKLSLVDCNVELSKESLRSTCISVFLSMMISWFFGGLGFYIQQAAISWYQAFAMVFLSIIIYVILDAWDIRTNYLLDTRFLQMALQEYVALYGDEILVRNKFVELSNSVLVNIPTNAETIYSERMQLAKYYQNAFIITVNNNGQKFDYILYSNSDNCSPANFMRLCKEQIGKNWNGINKQQIVITKAPIVSGV